MSGLLHPNRLARKLIKSLIAFSALITLGITAGQLWLEYGRDVDAIDARFVQVERSYLDSVTDTVWQADDVALALQLQGIIEFPDFRYAAVRDENGNIVLAEGQPDGENLLKESYPLIYTFRDQPREIGTLVVSASLEDVYARLWDRVGYILLFNALKTALVAVFLYALVYWLLTRHLETMAAFVRKLDFEEPSQHLEINRGRFAGRRDELDVLSAALNAMKDKLSDSYEDVRQLSDELEVRVRGRTRALAEEVAKHKRTAEELRVLSSAIEQNPSAVFITDADGTIQFVNDKFVELTGYSRNEAMGRNPRILKSQSTSPEVHEEIWATITRGLPWRGELEDARKDGSTFWVYATIAPVKTAGGEITHYVATHEDITARREKDQRLREATERAEVASRTKSEIMANMSHELRTPLNAIIGFSDTMLNGVFGDLNNERYEDYINDIKDSGTHLLELINDILDVSAIEAGKLELRSEPLDIAALIKSSLKLVAHRADTARVHIDSHVEKDLPGLLADGRRMKQVLLNLLSNAVKFTPGGGRVTARALTAPDGGVRFEVEDTGIGMDEQGIETALTQFGQVDSKLARKYEGTGLGLPLTKSLVELHKGRLDIRSRLGHGTTVVVQFPAERSVACDDTGTEVQGMTVAGPKMNGDGKPKTIH